MTSRICVHETSSVFGMKFTLSSYGFERTSAVKEMKMLASAALKSIPHYSDYSEACVNEAFRGSTNGVGVRKEVWEVREKEEWQKESHESREKELIEMREKEPKLQSDGYMKTREETTQTLFRGGVLQAGLILSRVSEDTQRIEWAFTLPAGSGKNLIHLTLTQVCNLHVVTDSQC